MGNGEPTIIAVATSNHVPRPGGRWRASRATYNRALEVALMFRTGNPALKESTFRGVRAALGEEAMTLQGTVNKTGISLLILLAAAAFVWNSPVPQPFIFIPLIAGPLPTPLTLFTNTAPTLTKPPYAR